MSSAFAMVLMAAMVIPGNGPEKVSGEVKQGLDLSGEWEGSWDRGTGLIYKANLRENRLVGKRGNGSIHFPRFIVEEDGEGAIRVTVGGGGVCKGIFRCEGDHVLICFRNSHTLRPTSFQAGHGQELLILHRVKPRK